MQSFSSLVISMNISTYLGYRTMDKNKPLEPGDEGPRDEEPLGSREEDLGTGDKEPLDKPLGPKNLGSKNLGSKNLDPKNLGHRDLGPKENKPLASDKNKPLAEYTNMELANELRNRAAATRTSLALTMEEPDTKNIATTFTGSTHMLKGMLYYLDLEIEDYDDDDEEVYA